MKKTLALMTVMSAFAAAPAFAEDVPFSGAVAATCTIDNVNAGSLVSNAAATAMSGTGANAGSARITANTTGFELSVSNPTAFETGSPAAPASTTFAATTDFSTFTGQAAGAGNEMAVPVASTVATISLDVASNGAPFTPGSYTAVVTITCS